MCALWLAGAPIAGVCALESRAVAQLGGAQLGGAQLGGAQLGGDADESEELRALRLAELEIFPPHAEPLVDLSQRERGLGHVPSSLTSEVPDAPPEIATGRASAGSAAGCR